MLSELEKSFAAVDTSMGTQTGFEDQAPRDVQAPPEEEVDQPPENFGRTNVRFRFPMAREIDEFGPWLLVLGSVAWLAAIAWTGNDTGASWVALTRFAIALLAYVVIVGPITGVMIRRAGISLGYQLPGNHRWRAFASYIPAFTFAVAIWAVDDGALGGIVLGAFVGVVVASAFLWLRFRLRPAEIAPSATYAAVGFFVGLAIASGLAFGLNALLINVLVQMKKPDIVAGSPVGSGFEWISAADRDALALASKPKPPAKRPAATVETAATAPAPITPTPVKPPATPLSPIVRDQQTAVIKAPFDGQIYPLTESEYLVLIHRTNNGQTLDVWQTETWTQRGGGDFANVSGSDNRFVLSPDGDHVARISPFPRLSAQVWSFSTSNFVKISELDEKLGVPVLVGFLTDSRLLVRWEKDGNCSLQVIDTAASNPAKPRTIATPFFDANSNALAISPDGTLAGVAAKIDNVPTLCIYDLFSGATVGKTPMNAIDPRWPVTPTGMAFSFDNKKLAVLFEQSGNGLLVCYSVEHGGALPEINEQLFPAGPLPDKDVRGFVGNALSWLPDNKRWLLYGQGVFDQATGRRIGDLGAVSVESARVGSPDSVQLVTQPGNGRQLSEITLDLPKIAALAPSK